MTQENGATDRRAYQCIDVETARQLIGNGALVLDVRDPASYAAARIEGAIHVNDSNLFATLVSTPKTQPIIIYCYHGHASQTFAQTFADFRFETVYSMDGGYEAWANELKA